MRHRSIQTLTRGHHGPFTFHFCSFRGQASAHAARGALCTAGSLVACDADSSPGATSGNSRQARPSRSEGQRTDAALRIVVRPVPTCWVKRSLSPGATRTTPSRASVAGVSTPAKHSSLIRRPQLHPHRPPSLRTPRLPPSPCPCPCLPGMVATSRHEGPHHELCDIEFTSTAPACNACQRRCARWLRLLQSRRRFCNGREDRQGPPRQGRAVGTLGRRPGQHQQACQRTVVQAAERGRCRAGGLAQQPRSAGRFQDLGITEAEVVQAGRLPNPGFSFGRLQAEATSVEIERGCTSTSRA
jgi:hypothetical protein